MDRIRAEHISQDVVDAAIKREQDAIDAIDAQAAKMYMNGHVYREIAAALGYKDAAAALAGVKRGISLQATAPTAEEYRAALEQLQQTVAKLRELGEQPPEDGTPP